MAESGYRFIDHPSDVGMSVSGVTLAELFINAAKGMLSVISEPAQKRKNLSKKMHLEEDSPEELLHSYLSEILWFIFNERFFPINIVIPQINENTLDVTFEGMRLSDEEINCEVKAVTYHQLKIINNGKTWSTKLIFDV